MRKAYVMEPAWALAEVGRRCLIKYCLYTGTPYDVEIVDGSKCTATGDGLRLVPVNKPALFTVDPRGAGQADLEIQITGKCSIQCTAPGPLFVIRLFICPCHMVSVARSIDLFLCSICFFVCGDMALKQVGLVGVTRRVKTTEKVFSIESSKYATFIHPKLMTNSGPNANVLQSSLHDEKLISPFYLSWA